MRTTIAMLFVVAAVLAACSRGAERAAEPPLAAVATPTRLPTATPEYRYSQLLDRDDIRPIYEPEFAPADQVNLDEDDLVLGVVIDGAAKAYPIRVLNYREMVNDELGGTPILATW